MVILPIKKVSIANSLNFTVSELCKSMVCLESSFACIPSLKDSIMKRTEACVKVAHGYENFTFFDIHLAAVNVCKHDTIGRWLSLHAPLKG